MSQALVLSTDQRNALAARAKAIEQTASKLKRIAQQDITKEELLNFVTFMRDQVQHIDDDFLLNAVVVPSSKLI